MNYFSASGLRLFALTAVISLLFALPAVSLTRWSTNHIIPDADFLGDARYVASYQGYFFTNQTEGSNLNNGGMARLGVSEWVDVSSGYVNGFTLSLKAKVLNENVASFVPGIAIGATNLFTHKEDFLFSHDTARWGNEFFFAMGKSINPIKLRLHAGMQTMPEVPAEEIGYFFGVEKYFGGNAYVTVETWYRDEQLRPSLFLSWRLFSNHVELSAGAVDVVGMFLDQDNQVSVSFSSPQPKGLVRPGIWFGFSFGGGFTERSGKNSGIGSVEEQLVFQKDMLLALKKDVDSIKQVIAENAEYVVKVSQTMEKMVDSTLGVSDIVKMRDLAMKNIIMLNGLYKQEPFDAAKVREVVKEVTVYSDNIVPILLAIALDNTLESRVHSQAVSLLGELDAGKASNAVLDILAQAGNPEVKIECLIALGKMKEQRAAYLMEQLSFDSNETVAFTAKEVLRKLGAKQSKIDSPGDSLPSAIDENKIQWVGPRRTETDAPTNKGDSSTTNGENAAKRMTGKAPEQTVKPETAVNDPAKKAGKPDKPGSGKTAEKNTPAPVSAKAQKKAEKQPASKENDGDWGVGSQW